MRADKVEEKEEHRDEIVCGLERVKALFGLVPRLELFVKAFDQVVGNVVSKALNPDVLYAFKQRLHRHLVSAVTV